MDTPLAKIQIPSSNKIVQQLDLDFEGDAVPENLNATYGFSIPVITDECPVLLQYFPLSKSSFDALHEDLSHFDIHAMDGKKECIIICESFTLTDTPGEQSCFSNPYQNTLAFIAGFWDMTEDPLMAATLFTCTFLTETAPKGLPEAIKRIPVFLKEEQIKIWLSTELSLQMKLEKLSHQ